MTTVDAPAADRGRITLARASWPVVTSAASARTGPTSWSR